MKKILNTLATVALLCALVFLGGTWPEETPRKKVVTCDAVAVAVMLTCGLYLREEDKHGRLR